MITCSGRFRGYNETTILEHTRPHSDQCYPVIIVQRLSFNSHYVPNIHITCHPFNMHVFVTGATGWIGSVIVPELISQGHTVLGLARSTEAVQKLEATGAQAIKGSLEDLDVLKDGVRQCDAVIHVGFIHDFAKYEECCAKDKAAIEAMGQALVGSGKPFIVSAGSLAAKASDGEFIKETDPGNPQFARTASDNAALALIDKGVKVTLVRLPPSVHGKGDKGFVPMLIDVAKTKGYAAYIEEGTNRWPAVHRKDAAVLYRLALENPSHLILHAIGEEEVPYRNIAEAIAKVTGLPARSIGKDEAAEYFGWLRLFCEKDAPTSAAFTRKEMGWAVKQVGLVQDIESNYGS
jgi:nucleoside-diphosphate-sugar epimerase